MLPLIAFASLQADSAPLYHEAYRPQFHFTASKNWLNDPNGLVFFEGEYHLFFQYNPQGIQWGDMHWGHAVSPDLVHWKELPIALSPDAHGTNYSGSAAVDHRNTTGFGKGKMPPLVAMYTGAGSPFTQCLASSTDRGRTWVKYPGNPVLGHIAGDNRDPRIFWHEPSHQWVMALYLDADQFGLFGSPDLKGWKELSRLHLADSSECPEFFEIPVEGTTEKRWVFYAGNFHYEVGKFDGTHFTPESGPQIGDYGANFYASQTYNNTPGRRVQIGWMRSDGPVAGMPFNQQMSFPCELRLVSTPQGLHLARLPVPEIAKLHAAKIRLKDTNVEGMTPLALKGGLYDLRVHFRAKGADRFGIQIGDNAITIDPHAHTLQCLDRTAPLAGEDVTLQVLVDRLSIEVFADGGLVSMTSVCKPIAPDAPISLFSTGGLTKVVSLDAYTLKSAW